MPSIRVVVRFRPLNGREKRIIKETREELAKEDKELSDPQIHPYQIGEEDEFSNDMHVMFDKNPQIKGFYAWPRDGKHVQKFTFDCIMWNTNQEIAFVNIGLPIVREFVDGMNGTLFAYGQTGSGKSFSMFGAEPDTHDAKGKPIPLDQIEVPPVELQGMIPRCSAYLFEWLDRKEASGEILKPSLRVSFFEIYIKNELRDLLDKGNNLKLLDTNKGVLLMKSTAKPRDLKEDPDKALITMVSVRNLLELLQQFVIAQTNRTVRATKMNPCSSRGHCIMTLHFNYKMKGGGTINVKLNFADLAGSEKIGKTGASGIALEEAKSINSSLTVLGQVITCLGKPKGPRPPFRDAALAHCLKDSLAGNCQTTLLVAASPHENNIMETISSFQFAKRCKLIKTKAKKEVVLSPKQMKALIKRLQKEVDTLKAQGGGGGGGGPSVPEFKLYWGKPAPKPDSDEAKKFAADLKAALEPIVKAITLEPGDVSTLNWAIQISGTEEITEATVQFVPNEDNPPDVCSVARDKVLKKVLENPNDNELLKEISKSESHDPINAAEFERLKKENGELKARVEELEHDLTSAREEVEHHESKIEQPDAAGNVAEDGMPADFNGYKTDMKTVEAFAKLKDMSPADDEYTDVLLSALENIVTSTSNESRKKLPKATGPKKNRLGKFEREQGQRLLDQQGLLTESTNLLAHVRKKLKAYKKETEEWKETLDRERANHSKEITSKAAENAQVPEPESVLPALTEQNAPWPYTEEEMLACEKARQHFLDTPGLIEAVRNPHQAKLFDLIRLGLQRKKFEAAGHLTIFEPLLKCVNMVNAVAKQKKYLQDQMKNYFPERTASEKNLLNEKKVPDMGLDEDSDEESDLMIDDHDEFDEEIFGMEDFGAPGVPPTLSNVTVKALMPLGEDIGSHPEDYNKHVEDLHSPYFSLADFKSLFDPKFMPHHLAVKAFSHLEQMALHDSHNGTGVIPLATMNAFLRDLPKADHSHFPKFGGMEMHPNAKPAIEAMGVKDQNDHPMVTIDDAKKFIAHVRKCGKSEIRDTDAGVAYLKGITMNELDKLMTNFPKVSWLAHIARFDPFERLLKQIELIQPPSENPPRECGMDCMEKALGRIDPDHEQFPVATMTEALHRMGVDDSEPYDYDKCLQVMRYPPMGMDGETKQLKRVAALYPDEDPEDDDWHPPQQSGALLYCGQQVQEDIYPMDDQKNSDHNAPSRKIHPNGTRGDDEDMTQRLKDLHSHIGRFRSRGIKILQKFLDDTQQTQVDADPPDPDAPKRDAGSKT